MSAPDADQTPATDSERVEQIRARVGAATPGPWNEDRYQYTDGARVTQPRASHPAGKVTLASSTSHSDARFIAHAPEDVRYLLALLAEQAAAVAKVRDMACDGGCNYYGGPEETCSRHGRPVAEVWGIVVTLQRRLAEQAATIERVEDLPDDLIGRAVAAGADAFGVLPDEIGGEHFDFARAVLRVVLDALDQQRTEGQG